ncbi:MAG TPA: hypothetical protein VKB86_10895 [Pyrinomonadaceae bacterium]|nr:hypothetical protein [Pyrinomonadaceae bacterium]
MLITPLLFFGLMTALLAARKGYNPACWFLAGGVIGLIFLAFRPFTNKGDLSDSQRVALQREGNIIGLVVSGAGIVFGLFLYAARILS